MEKGLGVFLLLAFAFAGLAEVVRCGSLLQITQSRVWLASGRARQRDGAGTACLSSCLTQPEIIAITSTLSHFAGNNYSLLLTGCNKQNSPHGCDDRKQSRDVAAVATQLPMRACIRCPCAQPDVCPETGQLFRRPAHQSARYRF